VRLSLEEQVASARDQLQRLAEAGIELDQVTSELEGEGVQSFVKSYDSLLDAIARRTHL
jgi:transaldolase